MAHTLSLSQCTRFPQEGRRERALHALLEGTECSIKIMGRKCITHSGIDIFWWPRLNVDVWISCGSSNAKPWINPNIPERNPTFLYFSITNVATSFFCESKKDCHCRRVLALPYFVLKQFVLSKVFPFLLLPFAWQNNRKIDWDGPQ